MVGDDDAETVLRVYLDGGKKALIDHEGLRRWEQFRTRSPYPEQSFDLLAIKPDFYALTAFIDAIAASLR